MPRQAPDGVARSVTIYAAAMKAGRRRAGTARGGLAVVAARVFSIVALHVACRTRPAQPGARGSRPRIVVHTDRSSRRIRPAPARHERARLAAPTARGRSERFARSTVASGTTLLRLPGGSWSNDYDWLGCELGDPNACDWTWAMRPSDFIGLLERNRPPGDVDGLDQRDRRGSRRGGCVLQWQRRRRPSDRQGPQRPRLADRRALGAAPSRARASRARCRFATGRSATRSTAQSRSAGRELRVVGLGERMDLRRRPSTSKATVDHDGFLQFRDAMHAVDRRHRGRRGRCRRPGRVERLGRQGDEGRRRQHRLLRRPPLRLERRRRPPSEVFGAPAQAVARGSPTTSASGYADHGIGDVADRSHRAQPCRVHRWRRRTADDDGAQRLLPGGDDRADGDERRRDRQPMEPGERRAPRTAPTTASSTSQTHQRSPAYYAMALWSRFGDELVPVEPDAGLGQLGLYGGRSADGSAQLLVMNPSAHSVRRHDLASIRRRRRAVTADVVQADVAATRPSVTWNGSATPSIDLTEPGSVLPVTAGGELRHDFPPYSITLLRWNARS